MALNQDVTTLSTGQTSDQCRQEEVNNFSARHEIYVSIDVEADGPIPGPHSMLSFGAVAVSSSGRNLGEYSANLELLPDAQGHPESLAWWANFPDAWKACRTDPRPPEEVLPHFVAWLEALPGIPVFVGWPATWDFMWIYWYVTRYTGKRPFAEHGIDIQTLAMARSRRPFLQCNKTFLPSVWLPDLPHTHIAIEDAREQAEIFLRILRSTTGQPRYWCVSSNEMTLAGVAG